MNRKIALIRITPVESGDDFYHEFYFTEWLGRTLPEFVEVTEEELGNLRYWVANKYKEKLRIIELCNDEIPETIEKGKELAAEYKRQRELAEKKRKELASKKKRQIELDKKKLYEQLKAEFEKK